MRRSYAIVLVAGLLVALVLAGFVSYYAGSDPDGLNKVAADHGFAGTERTHDLDGSPLSGYATQGIDDDRLSGGLAGVAGVAVTFVLGTALFTVVRRRRKDPA